MKQQNPLNKIIEPQRSIRQGFQRHTVVLLAILLSGLGCWFYGSRFENPRLITTIEVHKNDVFQFFYRQPSEPDYTETFSVKQAVIGRPGVQTIVFEIPRRLNINNVRLDLGMNNKQKQVTVKNIYIKYRNDSLMLFSGADNNSFFSSEGLSVDGNLIRLAPSPDGNYDPYLHSAEILANYDNLTISKNKFPGFLLIPLLLAIMIKFFMYTRQHDFLNSFYVFSSVFFIFLLLLPLVINSFDLYEDKNWEKRAKAERPTMFADQLAGYPLSFDRFYNDNFGFRSLLVRLGGKMKYYLFRSSSVPNVAFIGKEGWSYLNEPYFLSTTDKNRGGRFTDSTLKALVKNGKKGNTPWPHEIYTITKPSGLRNTWFIPNTCP